MMGERRDTCTDTICDEDSSTNTWIPKRPSRRKSLAKLVMKKLSFRKKSEDCPVLSWEDVDYVEEKTGLARENVVRQYRHFLQCHPSGSMDPTSFREMLEESLPGVDVSGLADHIWRIYDTNLDGRVDFREFMLALCVMKSGSPEENLRQIFRLFDINSDGKVDPGEMSRVGEELAKLGELDEELVLQAFIEMDEDRDGGVTQEEFVRANLQQRKASNSLTLKVIDIFVAS